MSPDQTFRIRIASSFDDVDAAGWNRLAGYRSGARPGDSPGNPFLSHEFLSALEKSGSATAKTGWLGQHLLLEADDGSLLAAMPAYLKNHSQGEYVFDHGWADAFERAGGHYYPKLQVSVPFTPATGPRFLTGGADNTPVLRTALLSGLEQLTERLDASSAHITFMEEDEWNQAGEAGLLQRIDRQFHWINRGYRDFRDFLDGLSSRKRKNIRKEREAAQSIEGIEISTLSGAELTEDIWDHFFEFYMETGSRKWGRPYLTRAFYSLIGESMADRIALVIARRDGNPIAGAINFFGDGVLYGRHWGAVEHHPFLHFELCYYRAIDFAIEHGFDRVEAGAQGEHKLARGYEPQITHSAHHIAHPGFRDAVEAYLRNERRHVEHEAEILSEYTPFKRGIDNTSEGSETD